jgi:hypothetical protein
MWVRGPRYESAGCAGSPDRGAVLPSAEPRGWLTLRVGDEGRVPARSDRRRATEGHNGGVATAEDVDWLVARLRAVVASSAVWAARGMTLLQLTALHLINALAPVSLTDLAQTLGTRPRPIADDRALPAELRSEASGSRDYVKARHRAAVPDEPVTRTSDVEVGELLGAWSFGSRPADRVAARASGAAPE